MKQHEKIDYVEFAARDLDATRAFFAAAFGWSFDDCGRDHCAYSGKGLDGGFYRAPLYSDTQSGGALLVFCSEDLEATLARIETAGGRIVKPIFAFPGGRRFHFTEPGGNELAVWSDRNGGE